MLNKPILLYYLSESVTDLAPPLDSMSAIVASSPAEAAERVAREDRIPSGRAANWAHFVAAVDDDGMPLGFECVRLGQLRPEV